MPAGTCVCVGDQESKYYESRDPDVCVPPRAVLILSGRVCLSGYVGVSVRHIVWKFLCITYESERVPSCFVAVCELFAVWFLVCLGVVCSCVDMAHRRGGGGLRVFVRKEWYPKEADRRLLPDYLGTSCDFDVVCADRDLILLFFFGLVVSVYVHFLAFAQVAG